MELISQFSLKKAQNLKSAFHFNYQKGFYRQFNSIRKLKQRQNNNNSQDQIMYSQQQYIQLTLQQQVQELFTDPRIAFCSFKFLQNFMIPNHSWCMIQSLKDPSKQIIILLKLNIDQFDQQPAEQQVHSQDNQLLQQLQQQQQQQDKELQRGLQLKVSPQVYLFFATPKQKNEFKISLHRADQFRIQPILKSKNNNSIKAVFQNTTDNKLISLPHLPIVTSLRITKIKSGNQGNFTHQLVQYFTQSPRIIQIGQIIAIKREGSHSKSHLRHRLFSYQKSVYDYYKIDQIVYQDYNKIKEVSEKFQENKRKKNNQNQQQQEDNNRQNNREAVDNNDQKKVKITQYGVIKDINSQLQDAYYIWPSYIVWPEVQPNFQINISPEASSGKIPTLPVCYNLQKPFNQILPQSLGKVYSQLSESILTFIGQSAESQNNDYLDYDQLNYDKVKIVTSKIMSIRLKYPMNDVASIQIFFQRLKCQSGLAVHKFDIFDFFSFSKFQGLLESIGELAPAIVHLSSLQAIKCLVLGAGQNLAGVDQAQKESRVRKLMENALRTMEALLYKKKVKIVVIWSYQIEKKIPQFCKIVIPYFYEISTPSQSEKSSFISYQFQRRRLRDAKFANFMNTNIVEQNLLNNFLPISRSLNNRTSTQIYVILNRAIDELLEKHQSDQEQDKEQIKQQGDIPQQPMLNMSSILLQLLQIIQKIQKDHKLSNSDVAAKVPAVKWQDVGGLQAAKQDILDTIQLPLAHPQLFASGIAPRSGLLFFGPPGTGKTLLAKAIATECSLNFISVKGPQLLNMYVGESQKNIRQVFQKGRNNRPCILFFDELDSLAPARGKNSDSNQVMDRIVAQLLTQMNGVGKTRGLFVIGATNRPDLLDSALLQPGRFDKPIYLGIARGKEERVKIMKALTRKFIMQDELQLGDIVQELPENFTGADFQALCSEAFMVGVKKKISSFEEKIFQFQQKSGLKNVTLQQYIQTIAQTQNEKEMITRVTLSEEDFISAIPNIKPSVSMSELLHYQELKQKFTVQ